MTAKIQYISLTPEQVSSINQDDNKSFLRYIVVTPEGDRELRGTIPFDAHPLGDGNHPTAPVNVRLP